MAGHNPTSLPLTNKRFKLVYRNEYDQVETVEGILMHHEHNGFVVINVNNGLVAVPKDRVVIIREVVVAEQHTPRLCGTVACISLRCGRQSSRPRSVA